MRGVVLALALAAAVALAGCSSGGSSETSDGDSWSYSAGGQGDASESGTLEVDDGRARVSLSVGGQADVTVAVRDDGGSLVHETRCSGSGGCSKDETTDAGTPGAWTVNLQGLYNGGISAQVTD